MAGESTDLQRGKSSRPVLIAASFSGPLPHPQALEDYNRIVPGAGQRILAMAEKEAMHRRNLESLVTSSDIRNSHAGLICGLLVGLGGLIAATLIAIYGNPQAGVGMGFLTLGSLVGVFVYGSRLRMKERDERWDQFGQVGQ